MGNYNSYHRDIMSFINIVTLLTCITKMFFSQMCLNLCKIFKKKNNIADDITQWRYPVNQQFPNYRVDCGKTRRRWVDGQWEIYKTIEITLRNPLLEEMHYGVTEAFVVWTKNSQNSKVPLVQQKTMHIQPLNTKLLKIDIHSQTLKNGAMFIIRLNNNLVPGQAILFIISKTYAETRAKIATTTLPRSQNDVQKNTILCVQKVFYCFRSLTSAVSAESALQ